MKKKAKKKRPMAKKREMKAPLLIADLLKQIEARVKSHRELLKKIWEAEDREAKRKAGLQ